MPLSAPLSPAVFPTIPDMNLIRFLPEPLKAAIRRRAGVVTLNDRLENLRKAGFAPRQIIDAGAYKGNWSLAVARIFPEAEFLLIEPQAACAPLLQTLCAQHPNFRVFPALLGPSSNQVSFLLDETNSRVVAENHRLQAGQTIIPLPVCRLDAVAKSEGFESCNFLKLDLQGQELNALPGAGDLFGRIEVIQTETSWLSIGEVPLAHEVIAYFSNGGYQLYDVLGFNYRPRDRALWQTDFIFVKKDSPLLASRSWA